MSIVKQNLLTKLFLCLILSSLYSSVFAHEIRPTIVDLNLHKDRSYELVIKTNLEALIAEIGPQHDDTKNSPNATTYNSLRQLDPDGLTEKLNDFSEQLLQGINLFTENEKLMPSINKVDIPAVGDITLARSSDIYLSGKLPNSAKTLRWSWDKNFGANALRVSSESNPDLYTAYLKNGDQSNPITLAENTAEQSGWDIFKNYIVIGFTHILPKGVDHILFVVGLFLLSTQWRPLLMQITSFTVAHSVTLALGMLGVIKISPSIVEPLIAASIIYICVENIFSDKLSRWRPVVIFLFGLLHGLGFSSVLNEIGLSTTHFVNGLISFNIGVEFGQLSVILLCFLGFGLWFRNKPWYRSRITIPASFIIAVIGSYWLLERTVLI